MTDDQIPDASKTVPFEGGLTTSTIHGLVDFVKAHYVEPNIAALANSSYKESWSKDGSSAELEWEFAPPQLPGRVAQPLRGVITRLSIDTKSFSVTFAGRPADDAVTRACQRVGDDLDMLVSVFLSKTKTTSLYFVFSTDKDTVQDIPTPSPSGWRELLNRVTRGNMMNLYILIMAVSFGLFFVLGNFAIFVVLAMQVAILFYSDKIALLVGRVQPTAESPRVTVVCVPVAPETKGLIARYAKNLMPEISRRLQARLREGALEGPVAQRVVQEVLATSGIKSASEEIKVITRNVYSLVKEVADRFMLPVPKIAIMNSLADNAAATGISPGRSSITITAGSLEDLRDPELASVIGHELGHIRGRDSLILFTVTFTLYFGGLYLWLPLLLFLGLFYYLLVFAVIFSVGKVLETRADTESVVKLGEPGVLASALANIGFRQLYSERYSRGARLLDWLSFDPHPPIYFRVERLSKFVASGNQIGNTLLTSIRDCVSGFLDALI
jgi:heat shock protein HtpX